MNPSVPDFPLEIFSQIIDLLPGDRVYQPFLPASTFESPQSMLSGQQNVCRSEPTIHLRGHHPEAESFRGEEAQTIREHHKQVTAHLLALEEDPPLDYYIVLTAYHCTESVFPLSKIKLDTYSKRIPKNTTILDIRQRAMDYEESYHPSLSELLRQSQNSGMPNDEFPATNLWSEIGALLADEEKFSELDFARFALTLMTDPFTMEILNDTMGEEELDNFILDTMPELNEKVELVTSVDFEVW
ncbi:hypothetical protein BJ165DRAFT_1535442 [Panaeolus papilionaceus]|nr:hypothetical protein BJ165DRAFT_1535442 [Panaeolus papilionaceus]